MPNGWTVEEMNRWWNQFHGMPGRQQRLATMDEMVMLADEADYWVPETSEGSRGMEVITRWSKIAKVVIWSVGGFLLVEMIVLWPKVMRLFR